MKMIDPMAGRVLACCQKWDMLPQGGTVLCAVSGGRDSMALLHLLSALAEERGFRAAAAHFNHRLRPTADRDEAFVRDWCREHDIPLTCRAGDVKEFAAREGLGIEDAARKLRYAFLETAATDMGADRIATAHHREDNAETVLLHLLRGSGLRGLGGIAPVRGKIIRPLLEISRAEIDEYVRRHGLPYVEDDSITLPVPVLRKQDEALRRRLVRTMGQKLGAELTKAQVEAVLALKSGGYLDLPENLCAIRKPHRLILKKQPLPLPPLTLCEGEQIWGPWRVTVRQSQEIPSESPDTVVLCGIDGNLTIAAWDGEGRLAVENGSRTIKRLFADAGVPIENRADHPALFLDGRPVAVFGVAADWAFRPRGEEACTVITLRQSDEGSKDHEKDF